MALFRLGGNDHYCWDFHGPFWRWCFGQGPRFAFEQLSALYRRYPDVPAKELWEYGGPRETWASQRPSDDEVNQEILAQLRRDGRIE